MASICCFPSAVIIGVVPCLKSPLYVRTTLSVCQAQAIVVSPFYTNAPRWARAEYSRKSRLYFVILTYGLLCVDDNKLYR